MGNSPATTAGKNPRGNTGQCCMFGCMFVLYTVEKAKTSMVAKKGLDADITWIFKSEHYQ